MRLISFNINGIRARFHQLDELKKLSPDVVGLQEIKVDDSQFPMETINELGYWAEHHGQKGHYGVANLTCNIKPSQVYKGFPTDVGDVQKRLITSQFKTTLDKEFTFINGYFPQGESRDHETKFPAKQKFYADLLSMLDTKFSPSDLIAVVGDFNVAPTDSDIGIKPENAKRWLNSGKCAFLPEERDWLQKLEHWGLTDTFRHLHPEETKQYSWFDYRSKAFDDDPRRGLRIDHIMVTKPLLDLLKTSEIDLQIRGMEKPSDHAPVYADFDFELVST